MTDSHALLVAILFASAIAVPVRAHHAIGAVYDVDRTVTIRGVVTEVAWRNPHVLIQLDATDDNGTTASWTVETRAPQILLRCGIDQDHFVKVGDTVNLEVIIALDGTRKAALEAVVLPGGKGLNVSMSKPSC